MNIDPGAVASLAVLKRIETTLTEIRDLITPNSAPTTTATFTNIGAAAQLVAEARQKLAVMLTAACPGTHQFVQHRDHRPPWCDACRYTADGQPIPPTAEMGA